MAGLNMDHLGRYALIGAAVLALGAIGYRYALPTGAGPASPAATPAPGSAGDVGAMIGQLEARLKERPTDAEGWQMLGWSYFSQERYADSARAYVRATALEPNKAENWSALGEALVLSGKGGVTDDAEQAFRRAVAIDAKDARARYFLGVKKDMGGDHRGAVADWIALLKDSPPGAPWEQSVRALVMQVAAREKIDVAGQLPPRAAPVPAALPGAAIATQAIPGPTAAQMADAARMSPSEQDAMVRGMVDRLAARLAANPRDADGWIRLMRARLMLDDRPGASNALAGGRAAFAGDAATRARLDEAARALGI